MIVHKFYLRDVIKGDILVGVLPERKKIHEELLKCPLKNPLLTGEENILV
jgi:hypothetical protein